MASSKSFPALGFRSHHFHTARLWFLLFTRLEAFHGHLLGEAFPERPSLGRQMIEMPPFLPWRCVPFPTCPYAAESHWKPESQREWGLHADSLHIGCLAVLHAQVQTRNPWSHNNPPISTFLSPHREHHHMLYLTILLRPSPNFSIVSKNKLFVSLIPPNCKSMWTLLLG